MSKKVLIVLQTREISERRHQFLSITWYGWKCAHGSQLQSYGIRHAVFTVNNTGNGIYLLWTSFIYDLFCFVNFYKIFNFYNIVRSGKRKWKNNNKQIVVFKNVTHNISDYFRLTSVSIFSALYNKILWQEEKIQITHSHRYLWTGPSPLFLEHRFFFHVNNILQLSMYHWIQCNILQLSMYHWIQWYIESCKMLFTWKKISMFKKKEGGGALPTTTCGCGLFVFSLLVIRFYYIKLKIYWLM